MWHRVRDAQYQASLDRRIGVTTLDSQTHDSLLSRSLTEYQTEANKDKLEILKQVDLASSDAERLRLAAQIDRIDAGVELYAARVATLTDDKIAATTEATFGYDPETMTSDELVERRKVIFDYVAGNAQMLETAGHELVLINKMFRQHRDPGRHGRIDLTDKEWRSLSNAVITSHIGQTLVTPGIGPLPSYPDGDRIDDRRYWDPSFSYLAKAFLDPAHPNVQAAAQIQKLAGRYADGASVDASELYDLLGRTMLSDGRFGQWTSDISRGSIFANQGLDSAAAAPAVAIAGDSPKRQATESAATERTYKSSVTTMSTVPTSPSA